MELTAEELKEEYWKHKKSIREIAKEHNTYYNAVRRAMIKYGIKRDNSPFRRRKVHRVTAFPKPSKVNLEWLAGFIDGEGWFTISLNRKLKTLSPHFGIGQKGKQILEEIQKLLGFGSIRPSLSRGHSCYHYIIAGIEPCKLLIKILDRNPPIHKNDVYQKWKEIVFLMDKGVHLIEQGRYRILKLRQAMNPERKTPSSFKETWEQIDP